jgi:hypothetical protein
MPFVLPNDVAALQTKLRVDNEAMIAAYRKCLALGKVAPESVTAAAWDAMQERLTAFLNEHPSWFDTASQMNRGEALEKDLAGWRNTLMSLGCSDLPPVTTSQADVGPPGLSSLLSQGMNILPMVLLAFVAIEFMGRGGDRR